MMHKASRIVRLFTLLITMTAALLVPVPARADGGPVVPDWQVWSNLKEGEQTAVVTLGGNNIAHVDLFVSFLDTSGELEDFTYFIPLGVASGNFQAIDSSASSFGKQYLSALDDDLKAQAQRKQSLFWALAPGLLASQGTLLSPAAFFLFSAGCGGTQPEATFTTGSSQIELFSLDSGTDLSELISTTGLDPAVQQTLERLNGQQIAVIKMRTAPGVDTGATTSISPSGVPGLHLSWDTAIVNVAGKTTFTYPLNTGAAWAHPIDLTSVYIVAPASTNFSVSYPKMGTDYSGYGIGAIFGRTTMNIASHYNTPAYAVDEADTSMGHIWRIDYTQSNPDTNIVVTIGGNGLSLFRVQQFMIARSGWVFLFGLLLALGLWMVSWRYLLPRLLPVQYSWRDRNMWRDAAFLPLVNLLCGFMLVIFGIIAAIALGAIAASYSLRSSDTIVEITLGLVGLALGLIFLYLPVRTAVRRLRSASGVTTGRAFAAYVAQALATSLGYLALMLVFGVLTGII